MIPYATPGYARTCAHLGTPRTLPRSGVTVLVRPVANAFAAFDACAPYPLLHAPDLTAFAADLAAARDLVSFVGVADPLAHASPDALAEAFPDRLVAFKRHHLARLDPRDPLAHAHAGHRRKARRAAERTRVDVVTEPLLHAAEWVRLYDALRTRHGALGAADFTPEALVAQLAVPGALLVRVAQDESAVSMSLWYFDGTRAHYHLGASDAHGYALDASYAGCAHALTALAARGVRTVDLGGAAGGSDRDDGLARFKRGWANDSATAWLCGRVLDPARYRVLSADVPTDAWFPAYRAAVAA
ncbi:MAG: GNAT family N-acetyltransferase [bacterium]